MPTKYGNYLLVFVFFSCLCLLVTVYIMEFFFGIKPCQLCLYQRYPYFAVVALGVIWTLFLFLRGVNLGFLCGVITLILIIIGGGIAFYHMGVEWNIFHSSCAGQGLSMELLNQNSLESILQKGLMPPCDQPYRIFGLSLSTWNFLISIILSICLLLSVKSFMKRKNLW